MMNVSSIGVGGTNGPGQIGRTEAREASAANQSAAPVQRGEDRVELSDASRLLAKLLGLPEIRQDLVDQVRAQIEAGTYDTPEKMDQAIESMLDDIEEGL